MLDEPIFCQILNYMSLGSALSLKKKARIRMRNAAVLIGVIDGFGYLKEGEVFIKIDRSCQLRHQKVEDLNKEFGNLELKVKD